MGLNQTNYCKRSDPLTSLKKKKKRRQQEGIAREHPCVQLLHGNCKNFQDWNMSSFYLWGNVLITFQAR